LLNAQFLAAVHVIVYAGAIMVLFLYTIMLMNLNQPLAVHKSTLMKVIAVVCAGLLFIVLLGSLKGTELLGPQYAERSEIGLVKNLGHVLFTEFLFPFEICSILLLSAMVGAVMLVKNSKSTNA